MRLISWKQSSIVLQKNTHGWSAFHVHQREDGHSLLHSSVSTLARYLLVDSPRSFSTPGSDAIETAGFYCQADNSVNHSYWNERLSSLGKSLLFKLVSAHSPFSSGNISYNSVKTGLQQWCSHMKLSQFFCESVMTTHATSLRSYWPVGSYFGDWYRLRYKCTVIFLLVTYWRWDYGTGTIYCYEIAHLRKGRGVLAGTTRKSSRKPGCEEGLIIHAQ